MTEDRQRFDALRFAYVCGKLDVQEIAWMEAMLAGHPHWQALCDEDRHLVALGRDALAAALAESAPLVPFERIAERLAQARRPWWGARVVHSLVRALQRPLPAGWAAGAMAMLAVVVGVQTMDLQRLESAADGYRGGAPRSAVVAERVSVIFQDDLTLAQLRALAASLQFEVVGGPDEQGALQVVPEGAGKVQALLAALRANPAVLDAHLLSGGR